MAELIAGVDGSGSLSAPPAVPAVVTVMLPDIVTSLPAVSVCSTELADVMLPEPDVGVGVVAVNVPGTMRSTLPLTSIDCGEFVVRSAQILRKPLPGSD